MGRGREGLSGSGSASPRAGGVKSLPRSGSREGSSSDDWRLLRRGRVAALLLLLRALGLEEGGGAGGAAAAAAEEEAGAGLDMTLWMANHLLSVCC